MYRARQLAKRAHRAVDRGLQRAVGTRPRLASIYFASLDTSLSREAAAVAAGRMRYRRDTGSEAESYYLLRRNIHRLEKGLIMRPRRPVFAVDYLPETMDVFERAVRHADRCEEQRWARDVLRAYFAAVERDHPVIERERARFDALEGGEGSDGGEGSGRGGDRANSRPRVPYARQLDAPPPVTFDQFMDLSVRRRSVRWFLDEPVSRALVDRALEAATQAPSACNRQPFVYRVFDDPVRARELAAIPMGTKGFADKLTGVVVLVGRLRAYPEARDRHAIYIDGALSAMAFMYALETLGLSSCPINWPDLEPQESTMARAIGLEPDERVIMLIAYGWPDPEGLVPYSAKREHEQLRIYG